MIHFFEYNWQVRDEWFSWCYQLSREELLKERTGGVGSILQTLFHIIDVEYSWIRAIQGKQDIVLSFEEHDTLEKLQALSSAHRPKIAGFLSHLNFSNKRYVTAPWDSSSYTEADILHHIIIHEIHHIGQLSIWARDVNKQPISSHYVGRNIKDIPSYFSKNN
ncbi:DinB family protein [Priestia megaterium]|jgi:uncharacterized damage-inducible protein DinB|nr:DinB family protein [Priestia megaterium]USL40254.1 DinB family protein [Priestia megaterium]